MPLKTATTSLNWNQTTWKVGSVFQWFRAETCCNFITSRILEISLVSFAILTAFLRRGIAYKESEQLDKSRADIQQVLNIEPSNKRAKVTKQYQNPTCHHMQFSEMSPWYTQWFSYGGATSIKGYILIICCYLGFSLKISKVWIIPTQYCCR